MDVINFINSLNQDQKKRFEKAVTELPQCDVDIVKKHAQKNCETACPDDDTLRHLLVINRWSNRICDNCGYKKDVKKLKFCSACNLVFYCDAKCQKAHWSKHKERCCKADGPPDEGYQKIVFIKVNT